MRSFPQSEEQGSGPVVSVNGTQTASFNFGRSEIETDEQNKNKPLLGGCLKQFIRVHLGQKKERRVSAASSTE